MQTDRDSVRRGDLRAFNRLVAEHQAQLYTLSYRALGDERIAAETVQAAVSRARGDIQRAGAGRFQIWLLRWAVAACQQRLRDPGAACTTPELPIDHAMDTQLQTGLCRLPADLRLAVLLVDVTGLDYGEAAEVLGVSPAQLGRRVAEARARLTADQDVWASPSG